jgi:hypothetical protein
MPKLLKDSNGYFRVTISPEMVNLFELELNKEYDWISIQGLPDLRERKLLIFAMLSLTFATSH